MTGSAGGRVRRRLMLWYAGSLALIWVLFAVCVCVYLRVAVDEGAVQAYDAWRKLVAVVMVAFPFALVASVGGGWVLAGRALAPVAAMACAAREITADRLSDRLPVDDPEDEFGHLAVVFNETLQRLEDAFDRLRRFTADASHELRTPLMVIRSVGENALAQRPDAARHADAIGSMLEESDRLVRLLDGLLMLTRAEAGEMPLQPEAIDAAALVRHMADSLQVLAEEKRQALVAEGEGPLVVCADRGTLRQALFNLVANAIRYTPARGRIVLRALRLPGGEIAIEVEDDGPGIAAEHHARIFERFYRIDPGRSRDSGGTGLGLAIAKWAAELNGGAIELASAPGQGSVFRIRLPEQQS